MANYVLEILDGDRAGEVLPVGQGVIRIGRKSGNDIVLADEKTSGVHCEIAPEGDRHVLRDLGSTNGTFLDGKRLTEIVLTPGDIVTVGRIRVRFRGEGDSTPPDAGEFAVRQLDAARLQRRGGSVGLLAVLLLVVLGGVAFYVWQQQDDGSGAGGAGPKSREVLRIDGNRLPPDLAACEKPDGLVLDAAGLGFAPTTDAHTGKGAFVARRDAEGSATDFAILRLAEPLTVFAGRALTITGHCRTSGSGRIAVRAAVFASNESLPFRFRHGAPIAGHEGWERVAVELAVPDGCDRLQLEVVAVLPDADAAVFVDDLAIVEGGGGKVIDLRDGDSGQSESGQTAIGFGSAVAIRSADLENPATLLAVLPGEVPAELRGLHQAGECVLSDLGAQITCTGHDGRIELAATGVASLQFVLPAEAAGGLLVRTAEAGFSSAAAESSFTAQGVLLGAYATRMLLTVGVPTQFVGQTGGGVYRLTARSDRVELRLSFRAERQTAGDKVRRARSAFDEGRPGAALDLLREVRAQVPMDSESLAAAEALRMAVLSRQAEELRQVQRDLEDAEFFRTRGGFERIVVTLDDLRDRYGEGNLEDAGSVAQLRSTAQEHLTAIDQLRKGAQGERLSALAQAFADAARPALQKMVEGYVQQFLR